jgi:hypothetical protein
VDGRAIDLAETPLSPAIATLADHVSPHLFGIAGAAADQSPQTGQ